MITFDPDVVGVALLGDGRHELVGGQNAVLTNEAADLRPQRYEGHQIDRAECPQKKPANELVVGWPYVPSPAPARDARKGGPMGGDKSIGTFRYTSEPRGPFVQTRRQLPVRMICQGTKNGVGTGDNGAIRQNQ